MAKRRKGRSAGIVAEATRIIDLTAHIDSALDLATDLAQRRRAALLELARLTGSDDAAQLPVGVSFTRTVADTLLILIMRAGPKGIAGKELVTAASRRIDFVISPDEFEAAIDLLLASNDIRSRGDLLVPWTGVGAPGSGVRGRRPLGHPKQRDMIVDILKASPVPLGISAIRKAVLERFGIDIDRTSISPLLTKLDRKGGIVIHVGEEWTVPEA